MTREICGIIMRETNIKEGDKLLDIYTQNGIITAVAKGGRSVKSKILSSTQLFCYANFTLYEKNGYFWIKEASLIDNFFDIRTSLERTAVASYICDVAIDSATNEPSDEALSLILNCMYALSKKKYDFRKIKAVFEMRMASLLGFMPDVSACNECGEHADSYIFNISGGYIMCLKCRDERGESFDDTPYGDYNCYPSLICHITDGVRMAIYYTVRCEIKDILSFTLSDTDFEIFAKATEMYLLNHLERGFKTLDFYHEIWR